MKSNHLLDGHCSRKTRLCLQAMRLIEALQKVRVALVRGRPGQGIVASAHDVALKCSVVLPRPLGAVIQCCGYGGHWLLLPFGLCVAPMVQVAGDDHLK